MAFDPHTSAPHDPHRSGEPDPTLELNPAIGREEREALATSLKVSPGETAPTAVMPIGESPAARADAIATALGRGVEAVIQAGVWTNQTLKDFVADKERTAAFITELVARGVLTRRDGDKQLKSSKLSKLRKIGEYAPFLRRPDVRPRLPIGYSQLYELIRVYEELGGGEEHVEEIVSLLEAHNNDPSRMDLKGEVDRIRRSKRQDRPGPPDHPAVARDMGRASVASAMPLDLLLMTPSPKDLALIRRDYAEPDELARRLGVHELSIADSAIAIAVGPVGDLPDLATRLLPSCGFKGPFAVLLARPPKGPAITDERAILVARRKGRVALPQDLDWLAADGEQLETLAKALAPDATNRTHLFATASREGWTSQSCTDDA
jgi:hypothetical protein